MHFFVGSQNPVKIAAARQAGVINWPEMVVTGMAVPSGVAAQPRSDSETRRGATNRAIAALKQGRKMVRLPATAEALGVGLEGGVFTQDDELWSTVWVVVTPDGHAVYAANGARFKIPEAIAQPILAGEEMGIAVGNMIHNPLVREQQGMISVVTKNFVNRTHEYSNVAKLAIGLWFGRDWQSSLQFQSP